VVHVAANAGVDQESVVRAAIADALDAVSDDARNLASAAALLPAGVSERVATSLLMRHDDAAGDGRGQGDDRHERVVRRALRELAWTHLIDIHPGRGAPRYRSLDPIRDVLAASLDGEARAHGVRRGADALGRPP